MIRVLRNSLLVKRNEKPSTIFIQEAKFEGTVRGVIVAMGSGSIDVNGNVIPMEVAVGDEILFGKNSSVEVKDDDGQKYFIVADNSVICVFAPTKETNTSTLVHSI